MKKLLLIISLVLSLFALAACGGTKGNGDSQGGGEVYENPQCLTFYPLDDGNYYVACGNAKYLSEIVIPETYKSGKVVGIVDEGFHDCQNLKSITIPDSVTSIGNSAFQNCTSLTSVTIPNSVTSIGENAFYKCTSLEEIYFNATAMNDLSSSNYVFYNAGKDGKGIKVVIGKNVTKVPAYLFNPESSLYSPKIISVEFENESVCTSIGERTFRYCTSLTSVTIPNSVTSIGSSAFYACTSLTNINVDAANPNYKDIDGNLYSKDGKTLIHYAIGKNNTSFTIPDSVTSIGERTFQYCTRLTSVTIPDSVTSIGDSAFYNCTSLKSVTIGNSVTSIGDSAFYFCYSLKSIKYRGTEAQWKTISKGSSWNRDTGNYTITYNYDGE